MFYTNLPFSISWVSWVDRVIDREKRETQSSSLKIVVSVVTSGLPCSGYGVNTVAVGGAPILVEEEQGLASGSAGQSAVLIATTSAVCAQSLHINLGVTSLGAFILVWQF